MIPAVLTGLLWLAAAWRAMVALATHRRSSWTLTIGLALFAASTSCWVWAHALNAALGIPNLSFWLARATLGGSWIIIQPLIGVLLAGHTRARDRTVIAATAMVFWTGVFWLLAPIHREELLTLDAAPDPYTTAFVVISYAWLLTLLSDLSYASVRSIRQHLATDGPGLVCAVFFLMTGLIGAVGVVLMTAERLTNLGAHSPGPYAELGGHLMPVAAATAAIGVLAVPILERAQLHSRARRTIRALRPAWEDARAQYPEYVVEFGWWQRLSDAPIVAERMRIEILDAESRQAQNSAI